MMGREFGVVGVAVVVVVVLLQGGCVVAVVVMCGDGTGKISYPTHTISAPTPT